MDLSRVFTADLERLRDALRSRRIWLPSSPLTLRAEGLRGLDEALAGLNSVGHEGAIAAVEAVLTERMTKSAPPELVWTGPEARSSAARDTAVVLRELFERAKESILLAGFAFDHASDLLRPLHEALARGATCRIFASADVADTFLRDHWPFPPPFPEIYAFEPEPGVFASLHAKCVVVDRRWTLVTSANFTDRGQTRNVEVGVLLDDPRTAEVLEAQFVGGPWFRVTEGS